MTLRGAIIRLLVLTAAFAALAFVLRFVAPHLSWYSHYGVGSVILFAVLAILSVWIIARSLSKRKPMRFVSAVTINFAIRFVVSVAVVVAVLKLHDPDPASFLVPFGAAYLVFTGIEAWLAIKLSK